MTGCQDAGNDGTLNTNSPAVINKLLECARTEEQLSYDEVRPGLHLLLQVEQILLPARRQQRAKDERRVHPRLLLRVPLQQKAQQKLCVVSDIFGAWSGLDVTVLSLILNFLQVGRFAQFITGHKVGKGWKGWKGR